MNIKSFVNEGDAVSYVANKLDISYDEAEKMYCDLGQRLGERVFPRHAVNFSTRWPNEDRFSVCIREFMREQGLTSLAAQYND